MSFEEEKFNESNMKELVQDHYQLIHNFLNHGLTKMISNAESKFSSIKPNYKFNFTPQDYIISFNYTHTAEIIYKFSTDHILHLHGEYSPGHFDMLYGNNQPSPNINIELDLPDIPINFDTPEYAEAIPEDILNRFNTSYDNPFLSSKLSEQIFNEVQKDFKKELRINCLKDFINGKRINKVHVIGHSLSNIDMPYFQEIDYEFPNADWVVNFHSDNELSTFKNKLTFIPNNRLQLIEL